MAKRKKRTTRRRALSGISGINTNAIMDGLKKTGAVLVGFLGGREISRFIMKPGKDGLAPTGLKAYLGTVVQAGGGVYLASMQSNDTLKYLGYGLTASGLAEGVSKFMKKDVVASGFLTGLEGFTLGELLEPGNQGIQDEFRRQLESGSRPTPSSISGLATDVVY